MWLDGRAVPFSHPGKNLVVDAPVTPGRPAPAPADLLRHARSPSSRRPTAPTSTPPAGRRPATAACGRCRSRTAPTPGTPSTTSPSDKAFYDITIDAPDVDGGGGQRASLDVTRRTVGGRTVTHWQPARAGGVVPDHDRDRALHRDPGHRAARPADHLLDADVDRPDLVSGLRYTPEAIAYLESKVGRYPFPTLGVLVVPSNSAMETQSMVTLGTQTLHALARRARPRARAPVVRRRGHPRRLERPLDERGDGDLPGRGELDRRPQAASQRSRSCAAGTIQRVGLRDQYGPPADYAPGSFAEGNAYYIPAPDVGHDPAAPRRPAFWRLVAAMAAQRTASPARTAPRLAAWWSRQSGQDLRPLFHRWLLGPARAHLARPVGSRGGRPVVGRKLIRHVSPTTVAVPTLPRRCNGRGVQESPVSR